MDLQSLSFLLAGILLAGYMVVGGAAIGVGVLALRVRPGTERPAPAAPSLLLAGEGWLLAALVVLWLAFPGLPVRWPVPALILLAVLRTGALLAAARSPAGLSAPAGRLFAWGSLLSALLLGGLAGTALGGGVPGAYAAIVALLTLAAVAMHGAASWTRLARGELQQRLARWTIGAWLLLLALWLVTGVWTIVGRAVLLRQALDRPLFWLCLALVIGGLARLPQSLRRLRHGSLVAASALVAAGLAGLAGALLHPFLIAPGATAPGVTIHDAAAAPGTLRLVVPAAAAALLLLLIVSLRAGRRFRPAERL